MKKIKFGAKCLDPICAEKSIKDSILGTIIAKSKGVALAKAIELTSTSRPLVIIYSSLAPRELETAKYLSTLRTN